MQELLNFKYQEKELCLFYDNQTPVYGKRENGIISYNLTDEEKRLIDFVYSKITPSKKIVRRSDINLNGLTIAHFVDKKNDLHLFYEIKEDEINILNKNLRAIFNNMFNNQNEYIISPSVSKKQNKKAGFFKRLVKIGQKAITVFVASSIILGASYISPTIARADEKDEYISITHDLEDLYSDFASLDEQAILDLFYKYPELINAKIVVNSKVGSYMTYFANRVLGYNFVKKDYLDHYQEAKISDEITKEFQDLFPDRSISIIEKKKVTLTYEDIIKKLENNPNLSPEEIEALISPEFIKDNLKYMDHDYIDQMINNLFITYTPENNSEASGLYYPDTFEIQVFNASNLEGTKKHPDVLKHEANHAFSQSEEGIFTPVFEIYNSIMTDEYNQNPNSVLKEDFDTSYSWSKDYGYCLLEILDSETIKEAYFKGDIRLLKIALNGIIDDKELADELLEMISVVTPYKSELSKEEKTLREEYDKKIRVILKRYYEAKYQTKAEENEEFLYHFDRDEFLKKINIDTDSFKNNLMPYCTTLQRKYYFNNRFFDENNHTFIEISDVSETKEVPMDTFYCEQFVEEGDLSIVDGHYVSNSPNFRVKEDGNVVNIIGIYNKKIKYALDVGALENDRSLDDAEQGMTR